MASPSSRESELSYSKLKKELQAVRTSNSVNAEANLYKMAIGIAIVAFPYSVSWVGTIAAFIGIVILATLSMGSAYLLFKARNRYKDKVIVDLPDLGYACYGAKVRLLCQVLLIVTQISLLTAYLIYLGTQA